MKLTRIQPILFGLSLLTGCGIFSKNEPKPIVRPLSHETPPVSQNTPMNKMLAIANGTNRDSWQDPSTLIPQPPDLPVEPIQTPTPPPRDALANAVAVSPPPQTAETLIIPVNNAADAPVVKSPPPVAPRGTVIEPSTESPFHRVKELQARAAERIAKMSGFEARLTRQETVNGKDGPEQIIHMKFRAEPMSMHLKWIGKEAKGREMIYVSGRRDDVVDILTAKGDGFALTPAGLKKQFSPDDSTIRSQARYDLREGGMKTSINRLGEHLRKAEGQPAQMVRFSYLGVVTKPERASGLEVIEERIAPGGEELFPKGGKRTTCFDADPQSASFGLPILVYAVNQQGRRVEYYYFDQLQPKQFTNADFDAKVLWK